MERYFRYRWNLDPPPDLVKKYGSSSKTRTGKRAYVALSQKDAVEDVGGSEFYDDHVDERSNKGWINKKKKKQKRKV